MNLKEPPEPLGKNTFFYQKKPGFRGGGYPDRDHSGLTTKNNTSFLCVILSFINELVAQTSINLFLFSMVEKSIFSPFINQSSYFVQ